ncbi:MAG TPA: protein phosphatase 2C domain-containing protein [Kofleriaceae bacterium]|nr:protein phosphatase 2C domain-containing protein [Kofleriaceae bacterium]
MRIGPSPRIAMGTDVGVVRERNEDAAYVDPEGAFAILADGMGGHGAGDIASATAVAAVRACLEAARRELTTMAASGERGREAILALIERAARRANDEVLERGRQQPDTRGMGTTLEIVVVVGTDGFVAHAGDSRTYLIREGVATQLTTDHTVVEVMRRNGTLSDAEAAQSPMRSVLCNAIGVSEEVGVEVLHVALERGDRLLACSDGLYEDLALDELADGAVSSDLDGAVVALIELARARGGHDNITAVLIAPQVPAPALEDCSEDTLVGFVERALREEKTQPHRVPATGSGRGSR